MWLNPQSWAVISGLATPEQAEKAMQTAFEQLNTPFGVEIMAPCYKQHAFDGANMLLLYPYQLFFPALLISLTMLGFNLLGDGLRDALDPQADK